MQESPPGVMISPVWGNYTQGAYGAFIKFPVGLQAPFHYHSNEVKIIPIKGAYIYTPQGGTKQRFGPGSFVRYPGGDRHTTNSAEDTETIFFIEQPGKFDLVTI